MRSLNKFVVLIIIIILAATGYYFYSLITSASPARLGNNTFTPTYPALPIDSAPPQKGNWDNYARETSNWKTYQGDPLYANDKAKTFTIKYPADWQLDGWHLYPPGKINPDFRVDLGAGGHGQPLFKLIKVTYPAGNATYYWANKFIKEGYGGFAVFTINNFDYIFQIRGIPEDKNQEFKSIFDEMLFTFKLL
ncbi:hypothetical protein HY030_02760 [Candidatus Gottesmanbacteria bacterium]|nr:hypothetical protein [Candidatus Gottesmanbacteria bacterium]